VNVCCKSACGMTSVRPFCGTHTVRPPTAACCLQDYFVRPFHGLYVEHAASPAGMTHIISVKCLQRQARMQCIPYIQAMRLHDKACSQLCWYDTHIASSLQRQVRMQCIPCIQAMCLHDKACSQLCWHGTHILSRACRGAPGCNASSAFKHAPA